MTGCWAVPSLVDDCLSPPLNPQQEHLRSQTRPHHHSSVFIFWKRKRRWTRKRMWGHGHGLMVKLKRRTQIPSLSYALIHSSKLFGWTGWTIDLGGIENILSFFLPSCCLRTCVAFEKVVLPSEYSLGPHSILYP